MQYPIEVLQALAVLRDAAAHSDDISHPLARAFQKLDTAGVFSALDEQRETPEAERRMQAIREERARVCTCSARRAGMADTGMHVLGCPAISVPGVSESEHIHLFASPHSDQVCDGSTDCTMTYGEFRLMGCRS